MFIDGAKPGDALKVTVLSFRPSGWGWTGNIPGFGLLTDQFPDARLHHWNYDPGLKPAMYGPGGRVPLKPMCGTIGVALAEPGLHSVIPPRNVGGNMDVRDIAEGAELYLPIEVDGALFSVGDTHAAQGDGEVCGTAIETAIDVGLKIELVKGARLRMPRYVTAGPGEPPSRQPRLRGHDRHRPRPDGRRAHRGVGDGRAAGAALQLFADRRLHVVQRVRRPAHQLDRRRAELGRVVLLSDGSCSNRCRHQTVAPPAQTKPRLRWLAFQCARFGSTVSKSLSLMPNHLPSVAAYWSTEVLGSNRPWPTSSGPLLATAGALP